MYLHSKFSMKQDYHFFIQNSKSVHICFVHLEVKYLSIAGLNLDENEKFG